MPSTESPPGTLPPEIAEVFLRASSRRTLVDREALFSLGSAPHAMFGLVTGNVQVDMYAADGRRFFAGVLYAGQWFGETPLIDGVARAFHAQALGPSEVAVLSAKAFWQLMEGRPDVTLAVARLVCGRYRQALDWIEDAALKPFDARLAGRLLRFSTPAEPGAAGVALSQEALAAHLGVARQTVNRQLKTWERAGLLRLRYARVEVLDRAALAQRAAAAVTPVCINPRATTHQ